MTSRRKIKYHIPGAIALLLGIVAFCMMFVAAAEYSGIGAGILDALGFSSSLTGAQLAFGYAEGDVQVLNFNILATLAYFLPLVGGLLALLFKNGLITKIVYTYIYFVAGAVLLFTVVAYMDIGLSPRRARGSMTPCRSSMTSSRRILFSARARSPAACSRRWGAFVCFFKGTLAKLFDR